MAGEGIELNDFLGIGKVREKNERKTFEIDILALNEKNQRAFSMRVQVAK